MTDRVIKCLLLVTDTELVTEIKEETPGKYILSNPTRINTIVMEDPATGQPSTKIFLGVWMPYSTSEEYELSKGMVLTSGDISPALSALYDKTVKTYKENTKANQEEADRRREEKNSDANNMSDLEAEGKLHFLHKTGPKTIQ